MAHNSLPLERIRAQFPFLRRLHANGKPWVYLDSAATTLKPQSVIDVVAEALSRHSTNIHRAVYQPGEETTELFEATRLRVARFIGASSHEIVFVRNTTEAINLVAQSYPRSGETLLSLGEHHSNLLPWHGSDVRYLPPTKDGLPDFELILQELRKGKVSLLAISHVSNVTGAQANVRLLADAAHKAGAILVLDAAQSVARIPIDVQSLDCDFLAFSGHKLYGPTGIGVLFGKANHWLKMMPRLAGGGTVESVAFPQPQYRAIPWRFEAGTPAIEGVLGLGAAIDYLDSFGMEAVWHHDQELCHHARQRINQLDSRCRLLGPSQSQTATGVVSFFIPDHSSHVLARTLSDRFGICIRSGHHCAQPLHDYLGIPPTLRLSFGIYNTVQEIDYCLDALTETIKWRHGSIT